VRIPNCQAGPAEKIGAGHLRPICHLQPIFGRHLGLSSASPPDDLALQTVSIGMVACGAGLKLKAPTPLGGASLGIYVAPVIIDLAYSPQVAVGIYLAVGGLALFLTGVVLSTCPERLLVLPMPMAKREGVFKVFDWR
jgi:hypothetical protein